MPARRRECGAKAARQADHRGAEMRRLASRVSACGRRMRGGRRPLPRQARRARGPGGRRTRPLDRLGSARLRGVPTNALVLPSRLGFAKVADACLALSTAPPTSAETLASCVAAAYGCAGGAIVRRTLPLVDTELARVGLTLGDDFACPVAAPTPTAGGPTPTVSPTPTVAPTVAPVTLLVPGGGDTSSDCVAEWTVVARPVDPPPTTTVDCVDGDPACDLDGVANDVCHFRLGLCLAGTGSRARRLQRRGRPQVLHPAEPATGRRQPARRAERHGAHHRGQQPRRPPARRRGSEHVHLRAAHRAEPTRQLHDPGDDPGRTPRSRAPHRTLPRAHRRRHGERRHRRRRPRLVAPRLPGPKPVARAGC